MKLSICVVTMNRAEQLKEALNSCLKCKLPIDTEFVIIDNASIDNTELVVKSTLSNNTYYFEKLKENLGCGGGRNYGFDKCSGEYVYVLDDDAVISQIDFFETAIQILDNNPRIITLTSQIFDTAWGKNRLEERGKMFSNNLYYCKIFCGGSHFIRKSFFQCPPYLSNKYGYEEIVPSMKVWDKGDLNVFCPSICVVHNPLINKWNHKDERNNELLISECAIQYSVKKKIYPFLFRIFVEMAFYVRGIKHLRTIPKGIMRAKKKSIEVNELYNINYTVKYTTMIKLIKLFGFSIF